MSCRWNVVLYHKFLTLFDALRIAGPSLMKWNRHLMTSNHIIGVKWSAFRLHVTNDSCSLMRQNEGKKMICNNQFYTYSTAVPLGHIDCRACLHVTLVFPNLFAYTPDIVWCRFKHLYWESENSLETISTPLSATPGFGPLSIRKSVA